MPTDIAQAFDSVGYTTAANRLPKMFLWICNVMVVLHQEDIIQSLLADWNHNWFSVMVPSYSMWLKKMYWPQMRDWLQPLCHELQPYLDTINGQVASGNVLLNFIGLLYSFVSCFVNIV